MFPIHEDLERSVEESRSNIYKLLGVNALDEIFTMFDDAYKEDQEVDFHDFVIPICRKYHLVDCNPTLVTLDAWIVWVNDRRIPLHERH